MISISQKKLKISQNLKTQRTRYKISRKKLALWAGVSYGTLRRFEETGNISFDGFLRLAIFLNWDSAIYRLENELPGLYRNLEYINLYYSKKKYFDD